MSALTLRAPADGGASHWRLAALLAMLVAGALVFAHGCHGADVDHEPLTRTRIAEVGARN